MKNYFTSFVLASTILSTPVFADSYKIFIDAGSSGSRIHLFKYNAEKNGVPEIKDIFSENVKPGLSSYKDKPKEAGNSLKKLLDDAAQQLQNEHVNPQDVEVNVMATAGMRLLDVSIQKAIYDSVKEAITTFKVGRVETISGTEEAVNAWLDINYLAKNFQNHTPTSGTLDMGGASTQIAFAVEDNNPSADKITLTIDGVSYTVFGKSFLGLGLDQARDKIKEQKAAGSCYPTGYSSSVTGAFDFAGCGSLYTDLIAKNKVSEQMVPVGKNEFYAFSGTFYTYKFFEADKTPNKADVEKHILNVCTKSWDQLTKEYSAETEKFLSAYCSDAVYLDQLFYGAYQLGDGQIKVIGKVDGQNIDWTLGAVLYSLVY